MKAGVILSDANEAMLMKTQIRKVGNSAGVVIPASMLREVNVFIGTQIELTVVNGNFIVKPIIEKQRKILRSRITLESLTQNYVPLEEELFKKPTGKEVITDEPHDDS